MGILEKILAALEDNAKATREQTELMKSLSSAKTSDAPKAAAKAAEEEKPAAKKAAVKIDKAPKEEDDEKPAKKAGRPAKVKVLTATEMGEKAKTFCEDANDDEDEFKNRRKLVVKIASEMGYDKFSAISTAEDQKKAFEMIEEYLTDDEDGEDEDEDGDGY